MDRAAGISKGGGCAGGAELFRFLPVRPEKPRFSTGSRYSTLAISTWLDIDEPGVEAYNGHMISTGGAGLPREMRNGI